MRMIVSLQATSLYIAPTTNDVMSLAQTSASSTGDAVFVMNDDDYPYQCVCKCGKSASCQGDTSTACLCP